MIGSSLEARVQLSAEGPALDFLKKHEAELPSLLIVSQVAVSQKPAPVAQPLALSSASWPGSKVHATVDRALGEKCPRCWTYNEPVTGGVCAKCAEALDDSTDT